MPLHVSDALWILGRLLLGLHFAWAGIHHFTELDRLAQAMTARGAGGRHRHLEDQLRAYRRLADRGRSLGRPNSRVIHELLCSGGRFLPLRARCTSRASSSSS